MQVDLTFNDFHFSSLQHALNVHLIHCRSLDRSQTPPLQGGNSISETLLDWWVAFAYYIHQVEYIILLVEDRDICMTSSLPTLVCSCFNHQVSLAGLFTFCPGFLESGEGFQGPLIWPSGGPGDQNVYGKWLRVKNNPLFAFTPLQTVVIVTFATWTVSLIRFPDPLVWFPGVPGTN